MGHFMSIMSMVRETVEAKEPGSILTYRDFNVPLESVTMLTKALSLFYRDGILKRITKGWYYKPEVTEFGIFPPDAGVILRRLLDEQKDQIAYMTGPIVYNTLRLTTQLSTEYVIATDRPRSTIRLRAGSIRFVRARLKMPPSTPRLAQLLDVVMNIGDIPGTTIAEALPILLVRLKELSRGQLQELVAISPAYPPSTRATLGILLEQIEELSLASAVHKTLNPLSTFELGPALSRLPTSLNWRIL